MRPKIHLQSLHPQRLCFAASVRRQLGTFFSWLELGICLLQSALLSPSEIISDFPVICVIGSFVCFFKIVVVLLLDFSIALPVLLTSFFLKPLLPVISLTPSYSDYFHPAFLVRPSPCGCQGSVLHASICWHSSQLSPWSPFLLKLHCFPR